MRQEAPDLRAPFLRRPRKLATRARPDKHAPLRALRDALYSPQSVRLGRRGGRRGGRARGREGELRHSAPPDPCPLSVLFVPPTERTKRTESRLGGPHGHAVTRAATAAAGSGRREASMTPSNRRRSDRTPTLARKKKLRPSSTTAHARRSCQGPEQHRKCYLLGQAFRSQEELRGPQATQLQRLWGGSWPVMFVGPAAGSQVVHRIHRVSA